MSSAEREGGAELDVLYPQPGPQEAALACSAQIIGFGGAAGGSKSFTLLMKAARHHDVKGYAAVVLRATEDDLLKPGGLWSESYKVYPRLGGVPQLTSRKWVFPSGAEIHLSFFGGDEGINHWQGPQFAFCGIDEATHFKEKWVWWLHSRIRTMSGVPGQMMLTFNPDPASWLRRFFAWWIYPRDHERAGRASRERAAMFRWYVRHNNELRWAHTRRELLAMRAELFADRAPEHWPEPISVCFIPSMLKDNRKMLQADPEYLTRLLNLPDAEREQLLGDSEFGPSWDIRDDGGTYFRAASFPPGEGPRRAEAMRVRSWDLAWTEGGGCWCVGSLVAEAETGWDWEDMIAFRLSPSQVEAAICAVADIDGPNVYVRLPNDGSIAAQHVSRLVTQLTPRARRVLVTQERGKLEVRASDLRTQAERGLIRMAHQHPTRMLADTLAARGEEYCSTAGGWHRVARDALQRFPAKPDDHVSSLVGCFDAFKELRGDGYSGQEIEQVVAVNPALGARAGYGEDTSYGPTGSVGKGWARL